MPKKPITDLGRQEDISAYLSPGGDQRQSLQGFQDDYVDIVDYIVRCTHKIWEEKAIGRIYDHYRHNVAIYTSDEMTYGRDKVIADSIRTMAAFPDIRLYADDVIWSGNDQDGFHTSHRITWVGHNTGYSVYGPPTGRRIVRQGIAHCFVRENLVVEEWIARDELTLIRQLGFDERELARRFAAQEVEASLNSPARDAQGEIQRLGGQTTPEVLPPKTTTDYDVQDSVRRTLHEIWNWRMLNRIDENYAANYVARVSSGRQLFGPGDLKAYLLTLLAAFPDGMLTLDHICSIGDAVQGYRVATRSWFQGIHLGPSQYGEPTGNRVRLLILMHHLVKNGKILREWIVFDEFALLKQLCRSNGS